MLEKRLIEAFARGLKPPEKISITQWAKENVKTSRSSRSTFADLRQTPWLIEPLETITGNDAEEVILKAPVGSGKTTLLEILAAYIVSQKPGPTLIALQGNNEAKDWMDVGLRPVLEACTLIDGLWPKDRHAKTKNLINFPHMPLWVTGANLAAFQAKSCDYVILDEAWLLKKSLLQEAKRRAHDRFNSKIVLLSQAGNVGEDFEEEYEKCSLKEFSFQCRSCGTVQPWQWGNLKYSATDGKLDEGFPIHYSCKCGEKYSDHPEDRRQLTDSGRYFLNEDSPKNPTHIAFHYTALSVWWIEWRKLVEEWLHAQEEKKKGNIHPLRQFLNKRLAQAWTIAEQLEAVPINKGGYFLSEVQQWDRTILTVDVQQDEFWFLVRTWSKGGESRLCEYGKLLHFHDIETVQKKWGIASKAVFLDSAYRTEEVKVHLAKYGWLGLNGRGDDSFLAANNRGKKTRRLYSAPIRYQTASGEAVNTNFSSGGLKDILHILKQGHGTRWEVADDVSTQYLNSLNSEIKKLTAKGKPEWIQCKTHNHYFDLEAMQITGAMMHGCYPSPVLTEAA